MQRELFPGFIKVHILHHAAREEINGVVMAGELARHGYTISPGALYPTLHKLERGGYQKSEARVKGKRRRIYYTATSRGRKYLERAKRQALELVNEILEGK